MNPNCFDKWKDELIDEDGDPFTLYRAFTTWLEMKSSRENTKYWCSKRAFEERRFYEMSNTKSQFESVLELVERHQAIDGNDLDSENQDYRKRIQKEIKTLKKQVHEESRSKKKLKMGGDFEIDHPDQAYQKITNLTAEEKILHLQFILKHSEGQFHKIRDNLLIKMVLAVAMYPNIAIGDVANTYNKKDEKQFFHSERKAFLSLHPNSVFGIDPTVLEPSSAVKKKKNIRSGHKYGVPSARHQLLVYTTILETIKPYLMNVIRVPAVQTLILCCKRVDVSSDFSRFIFDKWIEVEMFRTAQTEDLRNFLQSAILVRTSLHAQAEEGRKVKFLDKLARFMDTNIEYFIGKLGPMERESLVRENDVELDNDFMLDYVENTRSWLFIDTIKSKRFQEKQEVVDLEKEEESKDLVPEMTADQKEIYDRYMSYS